MTRTAAGVDYTVNVHVRAAATRTPNRLLPPRRPPRRAAGPGRDARLPDGRTRQPPSQYRAVNQPRLASVAIGIAAIVLAGAATRRVGRQDAAPRASDPESRTARVQDAVSFVARPFPPGDVRLLEGPFRDAMVRDQQYLLELDQDRLLHTFRTTAGLPSSAAPLGGWEAPDVELRGHSVGHYLSALALMYATTGEPRFKQRGDAMVAELAKVQAALPSKGYHEGYLSAFPESFIDRVEARERVWAPYYTLHKIMAGLLDMYRLAGSEQALDVVVKQAAWVRLRQDRLTPERQQAMLMTEFGGMNEVLANLYAVTGDAEHLRLARTFDHAFLFDPLARGEDTLDGLHANTQIPKVIGAAREYELTAERRYRDIATFFWERVALHRSYANGGHSNGEVFFPVEHFSRHLGADSSETCNTYNMLKLSRHLFSWTASARVMDFYERGLYNHILASQDPETGMMIYYCPLKPGAFRTYSTRDASFWCCVGTGLENHARHPESVYFHNDEALYVNLFMPSELTWREKGLVVTQRTRYPEDDTTRLLFEAPSPVRVVLKIRHPSWAGRGMSVTVNGAPVPVPGPAGSYATIDREWKTGDVVDARVPMTLRLEAMPDDPTVVAVLYGPILLAGDLGSAGLDAARRYGPSAPPLARVQTVEVPVFVATHERLLASIAPVSGSPLTFKSAGIGQPGDVTLVPLYKAHNIRYTAYWKVTPQEWGRRKADAAAAAATRSDVEILTIDRVDADSAESERGHEYRGEAVDRPEFEGRRGRQTQSGWFSYRLRVTPDAPVALLCAFRGGEGRRRAFEILVDGRRIASERPAYHPTELLDGRYPIPPDLTKGRTSITVRFQPAEGAATAEIYELRTLRHAAMR